MLSRVSILHVKCKLFVQLYTAVQTCCAEFDNILHMRCVTDCELFDN